MFSGGLLVAMCFGAPVLFWLFLGVDFFTYTHYPTRFNRVTRKVYFFLHNGPDGVVAVPWDDKNTYFHIGHGRNEKSLRDLRCHVLENLYVTQTFAIGHYFSNERRVRGLWEFIRRYMEEGPDAAAEHPLDKHITLSVTGTWKNCYMWVAGHMGGELSGARWLLAPFVGAVTLCRWLVFKSCKEPIWPPEVEAECAIDPNDPNRWPEPAFMGEFANQPGVFERILDRHRSSR